MRRFSLTACQVLAFFLTSVVGYAPMCARAQEAAERPPDRLEVPSSYSLGPGDKVTVWALGAEELSDKPVIVGDDGYVDLPLVGRVRAGGLTPDQLGAKLSTSLLPFVRSPRVTVSVLEVKSQPVSVMGAVTRPGVYQVQGRKTLAEVLSLAEGARPDAGSTIRISRRPEQPRLKVPNTATEPNGGSVAEVHVKDVLDGKLQDVLIAPHDVITVSKSPIVYVIGEVRKPGGFAVGDRDYLSVLQALSMAEGLNRTAIPKKSRLLRLNPGSATRIDVPVDLRKILSGKIADIQMQPDDILFVPDSKIKSGLARAVDAATSAVAGVMIYRVGYPR